MIGTSFADQPVPARHWYLRDCAGGAAWQVSVCVLVVCILSLLPLRAAQSEDARLSFQPAPIDLNTSSYGGVLQDQDGFIWFATIGRGVFRYDGYELRNFSKGPDRLAGSLINGIVEDSNGVIWIGSLSEGITRYDKSTNTFAHFKHDPDNTNSLSSNNLPFSPRTLMVDHNNHLWVGTQDAGLNWYDHATSTWTRYRHDPGDTNSISSNTVLALAEDGNGNIWIGTKGGGLDRLNLASGSWTHFTHDAENPDSVGNDWINVIIEGENGDIWIGGKDAGLDRYDPATGIFHHYLSERDNANSLASNEIWNLFEDSFGNIWVSHPSSALGGLSMFDRKRDVFVRYPPASADNRGLSSTSVVGVIQETKTGIIWAISGNGDVDMHDPLAATFTLYQNNVNDPHSISDNAILPIVEDHDGRIWVGTFNAGLNAYNRETESFQRFLPDPTNDQTIPHSRLSALRVDSSGTLWIGSWGGTLTEFDPKRGVSIRHFTHDSEQSDSISESERVKYIIEDKSDSRILWIATIGGGLNKFDKTTGKFRCYKNDPTIQDSLSHNSIPAILDDGNGTLWISTYGGGLERFDKKTEKFTHFRHDPNDRSSVNSNTLYEVYRDAAGTLWVSGKGGLSRFDDASQTFSNFTSADGLPSDIIDNVLEDDHGNLWLGTIDAGLIRFDPKSNTHRQYTDGNGLASNTFFWTSRLKSRDGTMWFGGSKGMVSFHPDKIAESTFLPPIRLTAIRQGGRDMELATAVEHARQIDLDWRNNYFEFQFAALSYSKSRKNTFAYKLEGRDEDWYYSGSTPFGRYTGLSGGEYTLLLKAANSSGFWNEDALAIKVLVRSPFWETPWFYVIVALVVGAAILSVVFYLTKLRKSETAKRQSEERFQDFANTASDWLWETDAEGRFTWESFSTGLDTDRSDVDIRGMTREEIAGDLMTENEWRDYRNAIRNGTSIKDFEYRYRYQDDKIRCAVINGIPLFNDRGTFLGHRGAATDVTNRKEAEASIYVAMADAERANQTKSEFLATMSHEFRTPLNAILGFSEMLRGEYFGPLGAKNYQEYATDIFDSGQHMLALVNDVLDISAIEAGKRPLVKETIAIDEVLTNCVKNVGHAINEGGIQLSLEVPDNLPALYADKRSITQIVLNLLSNATKFTDVGGTITVSAHAANSELIISIRDTGIGIPQDKIDIITEPFSQADNNPHKAQEGTGLGLSIVKSLVDVLDGKLNIESVSGEGTTDTVSFPYQPAI